MILPAMQSGAPKDFITLRDIRKSYRVGDLDVPVLHCVTTTISGGELVALVGASGSGKSTLMNILGCLDHPSSGEYWLEGREVGGLSVTERATIRRDAIGFVFQNFHLLARTSALENVMMPLTYAPGDMSDREMSSRAEAMLERVGLGDRRHHTPAQLSGGQQQRVAIARALINRPRLLLADEPTGNLDSRTGEDILTMFQELNRAEGLTILLVTHDMGVASHARRTLRMRDGRLDENPTAEGGVS